MVSPAFPGPLAKPLAPWWHTVLVLLPIAAASLASFNQHGLPDLHLPGMNHRLSGYCTVLAGEWLVVLVIWLGLRRRLPSPIRALVAGRWPTLGAFAKDLALAVGFIVVAVAVVSAGAKLVPGDPTLQAGIVPLTRLELAVWVLLAATSGFCEELVFRGYLVEQVRGWTGSRRWAIFVQGVAFGLAHGYYGKRMLLIVVHGWLLGLFAWWRKSLRPAMLAHGLQDLLGGVVGYLSH